MDFQPVTDIRCELGESPVYDDRRNALLFCDIVGRAIHSVDLATRRSTTWKFPSEVGSFGVAESGRLVVALRHEVGLFDRDTGDFRRLVEIEADQPQNRLNDGKVGPDGAFWVGSMHDTPEREPLASLYRVTADGRAEHKVGGIRVSNGLAFSPAGTTMFHSDSSGKWIDRWSLDPKTGAISDRRRIAEPDDATGRPDGGATDAEGYYWSAGVSAAHLNRFSPDGKLVESYPMPVAAPTMPCFGGAGLNTLFVTSLRTGRSAELLAKYPMTGITIATSSPVAGSPVSRFRDV